MKASGGHTLNPNWRSSLFLVNKLSLYVHVNSGKRPFIYHLIFPIILRWTKCTTCKGISRPSKSEESQSATNLPTHTARSYDTSWYGKIIFSSQPGFSGSPNGCFKPRHSKSGAKPPPRASKCHLTKKDVLCWT